MPPRPATARMTWSANVEPTANSPDGRRRSARSPLPPVIETPDSITSARSPRSRRPYTGAAAIGRSGDASETLDVVGQPPPRRSAGVEERCRTEHVAAVAAVDRPPRALLGGG